MATDRTLDEHVQALMLEACLNNQSLAYIDVRCPPANVLAVLLVFCLGFGRYLRIAV